MKKITLTCLAASFITLSISCTDTATPENGSGNQTVYIDSSTVNDDYVDATVDEKSANIQKIIDLFKANDIKGLAALVDYPLERPKPLAPIKNAAEFEANFKIMFPEVLLKEIKKSTPDNWDAIGSNGIVISDESGEQSLWLQEDGATIKAVNATTPAEEAKLKQAIEQSKKEVHATLANFENVEFIFTTAKYKIRIDLMKNDTYRYASWNNPNADMKSQPDLIVENGEGMAEGRLGDMSYTFKNGKVSYNILTSMFGEKGSPDIYLTVLEGEKEILNQDGKIIWGSKF